MDIVYFWLTTLAIICYAKKSYYTFIILLFSILSNVWGICSTGLVQVYDWIFLTTIFTVGIGCCRSNTFFSVKRDKIGKLILILTVYVLLAALISPLRGVETFGFSFMVARFDIFYLLYFVFRTIPFPAIKKAVKPLAILSVFNGILYYLQYAGIFILYSSDESMAGVENARFNNIPILTLVFFFFFFLYKKKGILKSILLIFFGGIIVCSQNRAMILGVALAIVIVICCNYRRKIVEKKTIIGILLIGIMSSGVLAYRFSEKGSTGEGIRAEFELGYTMLKNGSWRYYDNQIIEYGGTMAFRFCMILEKATYLVDRPISLIFGAGSYHENSMNTRHLPFSFGSNTTDGRAKVDTDDVALLSRFFRYGVLYLCFYFAFIGRTIRVSRLCKHSLLANLYFMLMVSLIGWAICGDVFHRPQTFIPALLLISQLLKEASHEAKKNSILLS